MLLETLAGLCFILSGLPAVGYGAVALGLSHERTEPLVTGAVGLAIIIPATPYMLVMIGLSALSVPFGLTLTSLFIGACGALAFGFVCRSVRAMLAVAKGVAIMVASVFAMDMAARLFPARFASPISESAQVVVGFFVGHTAIGMLLLRWAREVKRERMRGICRACGYSLAGLTRRVAPVCPECGETI